ncbi:DUF6686 family protein [Hymenobacter cellulosivorans]|uniref:YkgJ family cysteine cluster protein n=1 Tax=Hymenobacter cellulosivorans TaxID=2932249 RepID=A0ABY4F863_9BACT|nr:DUF6686 family protein [Hymenobacter cellulosivorans]UOQ52109.1 hypothetical protein MUN80_20400 [Hymenobacter cellulosivorans]
MRQYLHHNEFGCISRCPSGCCLHLYFGNVALCLKAEELTEWRRMAAGLYQKYAPQLTDPDARCITVPSPVSCQAFVFTLEEVFLLHDLLMSANLLLEAELILAGSAAR